MADFRRVVTALAVLALLTGFGVTASAQVTAPFQCSAQTAVPPLLRAEGLTELVGDIVLVCSGGTPVTTGNLPLANFAVFLGNTTVTSRPNEPLLLIDEPASTAANVGSCPALNSCVAGSAVPNTIRGTVSGNSVTFLGVPINPPGTAGTRVYRITNIRVNANALSGGGFSGSQVLAFTSISGSTTVLVTNPQQTVGFVQTGLNFAVSGAQTGKQCKSETALGPVTLSYTEGFATAFKQQVDPSGAQLVPGAVYNTESGLTWGGVAGCSGCTAAGTLPANEGLADSGTRLRAVFKNIPSGVSVFVSVTATNSTSGSTTTAVLVPNEVGTNPAVNAPTTVSSTDTLGGVAVAKLTVDSTGTATAVWEVKSSNPLAVDTLQMKVFFAYSSNPGSNLPAANVQATVNGSFAPISTVTSSSSSAPIPRFVDLSSPKNVLIINVCQTNLLFPFVTAADGFDTGIAIANTTADGGVTTPQSGTCKLSFFGDNAPSAVSPWIPLQGSAADGTISGGKVGVDIASHVAAGFRGYMIATCNFQFAHGFAFVQSTVGYTPSTAAMGYLALVLPTPLRSSTGVTLTGGATDEVLGQ